MTEDEAATWVSSYVSRETGTKLSEFVDLLRDEREKQNLVAASTLQQIWSRHIVDSLQLLQWAGPDGTWIDLGSGAGLPGIVIALARSAPVVLIEERKKRCAFLEQAIAVLGLSHATVLCGKVERAEYPAASVISARAYTNLPSIFASAIHLASPTTIWILPKGRSAWSEVEAAKIAWKGDFRVEPSVTEEGAGIIVATNVRRRDR